MYDVCMYVCVWCVHACMARSVHVCVHACVRMRRILPTEGRGANPNQVASSKSVCDKKSV